MTVATALAPVVVVVVLVTVKKEKISTNGCSMGKAMPRRRLPNSRWHRVRHLLRWYLLRLRRYRLLNSR